MIIRKIKESPLHQGEDEQVAYNLTVTPWGSSPSSVSVKLFLYNKVSGKLTDVSATCLSGSASTVGDVITTPVVQHLAAGQMYRLEIQFTVSGNVMEAWGDVVGEV